MTALFELMLHEMFELRMVQTDPNFANYLYRPDSGKIVLLDFGATRRFKAGFVNDYRKLVRAAIEGDEARLVAVAERLGYAMGEADGEYRAMVMEFLALVMEPLREDVVYDFARSDMARNMSKLAEDITRFRDAWRPPPMDAIYFHRKVGGMFLLASRLRARVNVHRLVSPFLA